LLVKQEDEEECEQRGPGKEKRNKQKEMGKEEETGMLSQMRD